MNDNNTLAVVRGQRAVACGDRSRILAGWAASGMSARGFALEAGVTPYQLYDWRRSARQSQRVSVPLIEVPRIGGSATWVAEVATASGTVRLSSAAAPSWAGQLIRELSRC